MRICLAPTDENFPIGHWISAPAGRWEIGLVPMLFGVRVRIGLVGDLGPTIDYCAGESRDMTMLLLGLLSGHMMCLPEEITPHDLRALFPVQYVRPMEKDKVCFDKLCEMGTRLRKMYPGQLEKEYARMADD